MSDEKGGLRLFDAGGLKAKYQADGTWDQRVKDGGRAVANIPKGDLDALENELGTRAFLEGAFAVGGQSTLSGEVFEGAVALDAIRAHADLQQVKSDKEFMKRYGEGDVAAMDTMTALFERAFPAERDQ